VLPGATVTFTWNSVAGADKYWLDVGNKVGEGYYAAGELTGTAEPVNGLPTDGRTITARLWTHYPDVTENSGWAANYHVLIHCREHNPTDDYAQPCSCRALDTTEQCRPPWRRCHVHVVRRRECG
jgi:hypothetical protein